MSVKGGRAHAGRKADLAEKSDGTGTTYVRTQMRRRSAKESMEVYF
jgi:hypothetical protein